MLYLCSYESIKQGLTHGSESRGTEEFAVHFLSGMLAETIACVIYVPVDVVKERMQVQNSFPSKAGGTHYRNSWDALKQIAKTEGLSGVYRGYWATLGSFGPFSALYFVFYERFKSWSRTRLENANVSSKDLPFFDLVLCSCSAGTLASWLTSPLDMAKLRLQIQRGKLANTEPGQVAYRGVADCLKSAYRDGGWSGLFRGAGARVLHFAPAMTITMTSYDTFRAFFAKNFP